MSREEEKRLQLCGMPRKEFQNQFVKNVFINLGSEQQILLTYTFVGILFATLYDFKSSSRTLLYQCFPLNIEVPSPLGRFR